MTFQLGRHRFELRRGITWLLIMIAALIAFELFNFSTTEYALDTFFGGHDALGMASWATVLSIAFCGLDFAGLSRLFTPESDWRQEPKEVWLLTGAWFLGAAMNATMTWWAVTSALAENPVLGNELVTRQQILQIVPLLVALLVWFTRVMLIGSIAVTGDKLLSVNSPARPTHTVSAPPPTRSTPQREPTLPQRPAAPRFPEAPRPTPANNRASSVKRYPPRARAADLPATRRYDTRSDSPRRSDRINTQQQPAAASNELSYVDLFD